LRSGARALIALFVAVTVAASTVLLLLLQIFAPSPAIPISFPRPVPYVALVELRGAIDYEQPLLSGATITPRTVSQLVDRILSDPLAKAVVLVINSPGGTAAAFEVYNIIKKLSVERVVVVYVTGVAASGGYLIALPAREIVANPSAVVGSVGAVAVIISVHDLLQRLGVNVTIVKSGELKDVASPYREITEEDVEAVRSLVDAAAKIFAEKLTENRGDRVKNLAEVLRAGVYPAEKARELGLVDWVGDLDFAISRARELAGLPRDAPVKRVEPPKPSLLDILLGRVSYTSLTPRAPSSVEILLLWPPEDYVLDIALRYGATAKIIGAGQS